MYNEIEQARLIRDAKQALPHAEPDQLIERFLFGRVTTASPSVGHFMTVQPQAILGTETEGGAATLTDVGATRLVYPIGPATPVTGDQILATRVDWRWVTGKRAATSGGPIVGPPDTGCGCSAIPTTLYMTVSSGCNTVFEDCTLVYGPVPTELSGLNLGSDGQPGGPACFLSVQILTDSVTGLQFRYHFTCTLVFFRLSRIFLATASFDAFEDTIVFSWALGQSGNTCAPFDLTNGTIYQGGNSNCIITISGVNPYSSPFGMLFNQYMRGGGFRIGGGSQPQITYVFAGSGGIRIGGLGTTNDGGSGAHKYFHYIGS